MVSIQSVALENNTHVLSLKQTMLVHPHMTPRATAAHNTRSNRDNLLNGLTPSPSQVGISLLCGLVVIQIPVEVALPAILVLVVPTSILVLVVGVVPTLISTLVLVVGKSTLEE